MKILLENNRAWQDSLLKNHSTRMTLKALDSEQNLSEFFAFGSFGFVEDAARLGAAFFCDKEDFLYSNYAPDFGRELLNGDYFILPACEIPRLKYRVLGTYAEDCKVFVRPNGGDKLFDGQLLDIEDFDSFSQYEKELVVISRPQDILGEWRFAVTREEILGVSLYRYQGNLVSAASCPPKMEEYVRELMKMRRWKDGALVFDIAQMKSGEFRLIECNSFSCSGQYGMKPEKIVEFVRELKTCG